MARKVATQKVAQSTGNSRRNLIVGIVLGAVVLVGGAILLGKSDKGQINVANVINESNIQEREDGSIGSAPTPAAKPRNDLPNGGLVGAGKSTPPPQPVVEGASTTDDIATSTDESAETTEETVPTSGEEESINEPITEDTNDTQQ